MRRYSFDTSAFIEPWNSHYPFRLFEPLWAHIDSLGRDGVVLAAEAVKWEIQKKTDALSEWIKDRDHFFAEPTEDVQRAVREVLKSHTRLVSVAKGRSGADPWVIAQAKIAGASVVTYEVWHPERKNLKIPEVCHDLKIECLTFVDFLDRCGIKFALKK